MQAQCTDTEETGAEKKQEMKIKIEMGCVKMIVRMNKVQSGDEEWWLQYELSCFNIRGSWLEKQTIKDCLSQLP